MQRNSLYYEAHVTIDPVFGELLKSLELMCDNWKFRVAKLHMSKTGTDSIPHTKDSFCTGRSKSYDDLVTRTQELVLDLKTAGFNVRRYKIEDTIVDSNIEDKWQIL